MAVFQLTDVARYPAGTTVTVYPAEQAKLGQGPSGSSTTSGTMGAVSLTFTGLDATREYVAYALVSGQHRYTSIQAQSDHEVVWSDRGRIEALEHQKLSLLTIRDLDDEGFPRIDSEALIIIEQTREGINPGHPVFIVKRAENADPYKDQMWIADNGAIYTGREIVCSQKRIAPQGGVPANGALIQGVSSVAAGAEPSMISASCDVDGPAFAGEARSADVGGERNASAFAAYDHSDVHSGAGSYSTGYGRKKLVILGNGEMRWGADLGINHWTAADVRLGRLSAGILRLYAPLTGNAAKLDLDSLDAGAGIRFKRAGAIQQQLDIGNTGHAEYIAGTASVFRIYKNNPNLVVGGQDINAPTAGILTATGTVAGLPVVEICRHDSTVELLRVNDESGEAAISGVDAAGAFFHLIKATAGAPSSGTYKTGAQVVNTNDDRIYICTAGGTPGTWKSVVIA